MGAISYSLYLFHPVVMYSMAWVIQHGDMAWLQGWYTGAYMAVALLGTVALSALTYYGIELPAMRMGNAWVQRSRAAREAGVGAEVAK